ncbi:MAG: hypothetical protein AB7P01_03855 [Bacteroidia bacterium]
MKKTYALLVLFISGVVSVQAQTYNLQIGDPSDGGVLAEFPNNNQALFRPFNATAGSTGGVKFFELSANGANYTGFRAPDILSGDYLYTLPNGYGTSGYFLRTDGAGGLTWSGGSGLFTAGTGLSWSSTTLNSVWTASGNDIYNNNSGNVGIGLTGPVASLHIAERGTGTYMARFGGSVPGQLGSVDIVAGSGTNAFQVWDDNDLATPRFIVKRGGNTGIGIASPNSKLHVFGDAMVGSGTNTYFSAPAGSGALTLNGSTAGALVRMVMNDGSGTYNQYQNAYFDGTNWKYNASAEATRFISSAGTFSMQVAASGTAGNNITWRNGIYIKNDANVGIGTTAPNYTLQVGHNTASNNTDYNLSILRHGVAATPGTYTSSTPALFVQDYSGDGPAALETQGMVQLSAPRIADADVNAGNALLLNISNDSGTGFAVTGNRRVGVGTTSPSTQFHTTGGVRLEGVGSTASNTQILTRDASGNLAYRDAGSWTYAGVGDNLGNHTATTTLDMVGNTINNAQNIGSNSDNLRLFTNKTDDAAYEWLGFYSGATRQGIILYDGAWTGANSLTNEFSISSENNNKLTLNTNNGDIALMPKVGNVGIGTLTPGALLQVGTGSNRYATISSTGLITGRFDDNSIPDILTMENRAITAVNHGVDIVANLNISGGAGILSGQIRIGAEDTYAAAANQDAYMTFSTSSNGTLGERVRIKSDGNLGIGTTNPLSTLDVGGTSNSAYIQNMAAWGLNARTQGLMIMPEGTVTDDGAGNLTFGGNVIVMNPLSGSYIRVAAGTYALGSWGTLYVNMPPTSARGTTVTPLVTAWADGDRNYDGRDRILLAQRNGGGRIWTAFGNEINATPRGVILLWSGSVATIPSGWALCNGASGTPDLRDRFVVGAGNTYAVAATGGAATSTLAVANLPNHTHTYDDAFFSENNLTMNGGVTRFDPASTGNNLPGSGDSDNDNQYIYQFPGRSTTGTTSATATAFTNLPPYYALCYIMKL